jgi:acyl-[acyl-carrier-protein]-phospholipid O-acyltransferase/long-chain-fatty-acid--[acyl-carrier-protein] ligase
VFAVTGIPDERKGEQLAVLHTIDEARISEILGRLASNGLPNLFMPPRGNFVKVDALPVLGTGKMDLRALKRIATERLSLKSEIRDPQPES